MSVVLETHVDCGKYSNEFNSATRTTDEVRSKFISQTSTLHLWYTTCDHYTILIELSSRKAARYTDNKYTKSYVNARRQWEKLS